jgi:uncharacterized protein YbjT (DUF2867 family)
MNDKERNDIKNVALAGATGYLGSFIAKELQKMTFTTRLIVRNAKRLKKKNIEADEIVKAELTQPETIIGCCDNIDVVISTVGITRQKEGLTYMDVDYQANLNLLREARKSGVRKIIYVSVLNGENLRHLKICAAKEKFVEQLKKSGMEYCVIRPNGFFSDMTELYMMAKKGRVYLFGNGEWKVNPIHGEDLATVCVGAIESAEREIKVGGPETFTHKEIAETAFDVLDREPQITYIPDWIRTAILKMVRIFTGSNVYGPLEFFLTVMAMDMLAPQYGQHTLKEYFNDLKDRSA